MIPLKIQLIWCWEGRIISFNVLFHKVEMNIFSCFLLDMWIDITHHWRVWNRGIEKSLIALNHNKSAFFLELWVFGERCLKSCSLLPADHCWWESVCWLDLFSGLGFSNIYFNSINYKNLPCKIKALLKFAFYAVSMLYLGTMFKR